MIRGGIRTLTEKHLNICCPVSYHCVTLTWSLAYKLCAHENNTLGIMSISRKANTFLEFFQSTYDVLLIKQHTQS